MRGDHLARFTSWRDTTELTVDAVSLAFLADGETVEQHAELAAARRRRRVVTAISAAAVVSLAFAVLAAYLGLQ
ncbi:MAG: hypothetical protein GWO04_32055, partial [Actinobacteria bacterium]|nr:hypothetical protein [Actinomycetota bacterium]